MKKEKPLVFLQKQNKKKQETFFACFQTDQIRGILILARHEYT